MIRARGWRPVVAARAILSAVICVAITLGSVAAADAAFWTPPKPKKGHASYKWLDYGCVPDGNGNNKAYARIRTDVYKLKSKYGQFKQKIKLQIDRLAGYDDSDPTWREVASNTFSKDKWFQKGSTAQQLGIGLPDAAVSTFRTGIRSGYLGELTAKATVWLKRNGSPKSVWRYKVRTPKFTCPGFSLDPAPAPPSANGGG